MICACNEPVKASDICTVKIDSYANAHPWSMVVLQMDRTTMAIYEPPGTDFAGISLQPTFSNAYWQAPAFQRRLDDRTGTNSQSRIYLRRVVQPIGLRNAACL